MLFRLFINRRVETVTLHFYFRTIGCERAVSSPAIVNQRKKTMKKAILALIALVFVVGMLVSCNKSVCPAYVIDDNAVQTENNG